MSPFGVFKDHGLVPGAKVHIIDVAPSLGMMTLQVATINFLWVSRRRKRSACTDPIPRGLIRACLL